MTRIANRGGELGRRALRIALVAVMMTAVGHLDRTAGAADEDMLSAAHLYHPIGRPMPIVLALRGRTQVPDAGFSLLLVAGDGEVLDSAEGVRPGEFDLGELLPAVLEIDRAVRVQVIAEGEPIGTPLVVEPLTGREPVRTVRDVRPDGGARYTRIIGFGETLLDGASEEDRATLAAQKASPDWDPGEPRVLTGFRIHPDRDVVLETDFGEIRVELAPESAPNTAWNFRHLAEQGFYDDTLVHRVVHFDRSGRRFVIQGGDPSGTGNGGPGWDLPMERSDLPHDLGVISMARADHPDSAGSQWFICLSREGTARLDGQYCAFGWATTGEEAIARIADVEIEDVETGRPTHPPRVARMRLVPARPLRPGAARRDGRIEAWWTAPTETDAEGRRPR